MRFTENLRNCHPGNGASFLELFIRVPAETQRFMNTNLSRMLLAEWNCSESRGTWGSFQLGSTA